MAQNAATRTYGIVVTVALLVGLAGCGMLGGGGCGPGETEITNAADADGSVSVTGEVTETGQVSFVVDDGTATAFIQRPGDVSEGDCVTVEGRTVDTSNMGGADVAMQATNITVN